MAISLDNVFGIHEQALKLRAQRTELLASNLANADTPGYKAKDIDFESALRGAMGGSAGATSTAMRTTHSGHIQDPSGGALDAWIKYRVPHQPALDGNTVETHIEQAAFARNAVEYQATLQFLSSKSKNLMQAIKGSE